MGRPPWKRARSWIGRRLELSMCRSCVAGSPCRTLRSPDMVWPAGMSSGISHTSLRSRPTEPRPGPVSGVIALASGCKAHFVTSGPRYEEPFAWWGPGWQAPAPRDIADLLRDETIDAWTAANLWAALARRQSLAVVAGESEVGKTTLLTALLDFLPPNTRRVYLRGCFETFAFLVGPGNQPLADSPAHQRDQSPPAGLFVGAGGRPNPGGRAARVHAAGDRPCRLGSRIRGSAHGEPAPHPDGSSGGIRVRRGHGAR